MPARTGRHRLVQAIVLADVPRCRHLEARGSYRVSLVFNEPGESLFRFGEFALLGEMVRRSNHALARNNTVEATASKIVERDVSLGKEME